MTLDSGVSAGTWRDTTAPASARVADLMTRMTLREKVAQMYGAWLDVDDTAGEVAPHQHDQAPDPIDWPALIPHGLGQVTRAYGTTPIAPADGARRVARLQREIIAAGRFGLPAIVHEECLTGLAAWQATIYPAPLSWGASFDPELIERMGAQIGRTMRRLGIQQGLAPVLDVVRDLRWGRVEETIGEDPHLVGTIGAAYVRGLESAGVVATLKHFAGYSASRAGRNLAPVSIGPRELADVLLPPFEMALRAGARSVMNSYTDLDGVPAAADPALLTDLLRDRLRFDGTVVSDYFSVAFLQTLHGVAGTRADAPRSPCAPASTSSCPAPTATARRCWTPSRPATSTRPSSTGPSPGSCCRSAPSACSTRTGSRRLPRCPTPLWTSTRPRPVTWPGSSRNARSSCCATNPRCRCAPAPGSPSSVPAQRSPARCSAATRSPGTSWCTTRTCPRACPCRRCWTR
ncbi:hypothetical protein GCM10027610_068980 [Dactylosporangium cerinum]